MHFKVFTFILAVFLLAACNEDEISISPSEEVSKPRPCMYDKLDEKVWESGGKKWLWGGEQDSMHFNISNWALDGCNLNYGFGRETYQALLKPTYIKINEANGILENDKCIVMFTDGGVKVYPYSLLSFYETVNEFIDGHPVAVAYCELADLAVVYDRLVCNQILNFAVSGYTYRSPGVFDGIESFVLWDRETESLWWPLLDMGVSGFFNGYDLRKMPASKWKEMKWQDVLITYPDAYLLEYQEQDIPSQNFKIDQELIDC